jgi:hypothetical protein
MTTTKRDREKAVKQALANGALEGLAPTPQHLALLDRYIAGEMSIEEAIDYNKVRFQQQARIDNAIRDGLTVLKQEGS